MGDKITDINEFREGRDVDADTIHVGTRADIESRIASLDNKTEGDYMAILVGEDDDGGDVVLIMQVEAEGTTRHKNTITMNKDMLHTLIDELLLAVSRLEDKESE
tara:strand:- start:3121 stop:3435 length:315 start_codon:yes stop_codon:yes gene_type:complete